MFRHRETAHTLGEHAILGNETIAELVGTVEELRAAVTELQARVDSQFTTIAAHAEIARQQSEIARSEARSDLERTRETLITLIEQVRSAPAAEPRTRLAGSPPGPSIEMQHERIGNVESIADELRATVERCVARQNDLAATMAAFLDTMYAERRNEPVAGLSLS